MPLRVLARAFYARDPVTVARGLLNKQLVRRTREGVTRGRVVEVEAYLADSDPACHAHRGLTPRNAVMFGDPGILYVYPIHSRYCLNVVTEAKDVPSAVLIRAVEPLEGMRLMSCRRPRSSRADLARGPARLCEAFAVNRELNAWDLTRRQRIWLGEDLDGEPPGEIASSPRIGVTSAQELELRFFVKGNRFVSGPRLGR